MYINIPIYIYTFVYIYIYTYYTLLYTYVPIQRYTCCMYISYIYIYILYMYLCTCTCTCTCVCVCVYVHAYIWAAVLHGTSQNQTARLQLPTITAFLPWLSLRLVGNSLRSPNLAMDQPRTATDWGEQLDRVKTLV